jgi:tetratricopeptide (TPR) repeat protein
MIRFSANPAVERAMNAGEAAFARRDFDAALTAYAKALELEPTNYFAALFTANAYDRKNDFARASQWYGHAIRLKPDIETAFRYFADMLARQGDMAKARSMLIHAAVAEPYNKIVWREIRAWALINHTAFISVSADPSDREGWFHPDRPSGFGAARTTLDGLAGLLLGDHGLAKRRQV